MGNNDVDDYEVVQWEDAGAERPVSKSRNRMEAFSQLEKDLAEQVSDRLIAQ